MPRTGEKTREKLLDAAQALVLDHGFAGMSIDMLLADVGMTKGAFFYHFKSKSELGRAIVERYAQADRTHLETDLERASRLADDPIQRLLVFVGLLVEEAEGLAGPAPGCLYASYAYQSREFDEATRDISKAAIEYWRTRLGAMAQEALESRTPKFEVDAGGLTDHLLSIYEGAFVLGRIFDDSGFLARELVQYRNYLRMLFEA